jgi:hypothetical protein
VPWISFVEGVEGNTGISNNQSRQGNSNPETSLFDGRKSLIRFGAEIKKFECFELPRNGPMWGAPIAAEYSEGIYPRSE